jgi:hypothetical protein
MKKLALSLVLGASLAVAPSVFALTSMTDANMKSATGQAGVTIAVDKVVIESFAGSTAYIDTDGTKANAALTAAGAPATGGAIIIGQRHTLKEFDALGTGAAYTTAFSNKVNTLMADAITAGTMTAWDAGTVQGEIMKASGLVIDVGACSLLSAANYLNTVTDGSLGTADMISADGTLDEESTAVKTAIGAGVSTDALASYGVVLGLPTLMISTTADSYTVSSARVNADGSFGVQKDFIKISKGASVMAILGGTVEIAAH